MAEPAARYGASRRQVCGALRFPRATHYYKSVKGPQDALRIRLRDLAAARVKYGYRRLHVLLRRDGWLVNRKRVLRLYQQEALGLRRKTTRHRASARPREGRPPVGGADQVWAMDFVSVALADGRKARVLCVLDIYTREALAVRADARFTADMVVRVLDELKCRRGVPAGIRGDNGPEFAGKMLDLWAYCSNVTLAFSRPGKPTDNAFMERFNGRLRAECLDPRWFLCLQDLRSGTESWRVGYNRERPHSALGNQAPEEFAAKKAGETKPDQGPKLAQPVVSRWGPGQDAVPGRCLLNARAIPRTKSNPSTSRGLTEMWRPKQPQEDSPSHASQALMAANAVNTATATGRAVRGYTPLNSHRPSADSA